MLCLFCNVAEYWEKIKKALDKRRMICYNISVKQSHHTLTRRRARRKREQRDLLYSLPSYLLPLTAYIKQSGAVVYSISTPKRDNYV